MQSGAQAGLLLHLESASDVVRRRFTQPYAGTGKELHEGRQRHSQGTVHIDRSKEACNVDQLPTLHLLADLCQYLLNLRWHAATAGADAKAKVLPLPSEEPGLIRVSAAIVLPSPGRTGAGSS